MRQQASAPKLQRSQSERIKNRAKQFMRRMDIRRDTRHKTITARDIGAPVMVTHTQGAQLVEPLNTVGGTDEQQRKKLAFSSQCNVLLQQKRTVRPTVALRRR